MLECLPSSSGGIPSELISDSSHHAGMDRLGEGDSSLVLVVSRGGDTPWPSHRLHGWEVGAVCFLKVLNSVAASPSKVLRESVMFLVLK